MLMMQQHSQSNDTSYRTSPSYCLRLLIRDNCNNPLLECQCCSLTNTYARHAHIHAHTNTLQSTGTCFFFFFFSSNRPVFKCCMLLGYMRVKQPIVHQRQLPPWHEASISAAAALPHPLSQSALVLPQLGGQELVLLLSDLSQLLPRFLQLALLPQHLLLRRNDLSRTGTDDSKNDTFDWSWSHSCGSLYM